mmetsp:Transcript_10132/g.39581  ORF Transcript_10132/g.39581 Transcript_10132/m.39581 type:complete len:200 (+) Transcript_10132:209-808(+)
MGYGRRPARIPSRRSRWTAPGPGRHRPTTDRATRRPRWDRATPRPARTRRRPRRRLAPPRRRPTSRSTRSTSCGTSSPIAWSRLRPSRMKTFAIASSSGKAPTIPRAPASPSAAPPPPPTPTRRSPRATRRRSTRTAAVHLPTRWRHPTVDPRRLTRTPRRRLRCSPRWTVHLPTVRLLSSRRPRSRRRSTASTTPRRR